MGAGGRWFARMAVGEIAASVRAMPLWAVTIVICTVVWVAGTIAFAAGAVHLVRHEPH